MEELRMKYFVLKPKGNDAYANASRIAMAAYAKAINDENPKLKQELVDWIFEETSQCPPPEQTKH